ncbi:MAG TPA: TIGR04255 family protein [Clostridiales bacterium]|nr:TIGR04255 family protein [Clostridiales bacterium]
MTNVKRSDLHHNFLKSIIVRLDFQGVLESEMDKVLIHIKPYAKEHGFLRYEEKNANQIDIAFTDKGIQNSFEATNKVRSQKVFSFINEDRGFVLDVSNNFICLMVNTTRYTPFEDYCLIIPSIAEIYNNNIDFFTVKRFGLRKINECLILEKERIKEFFAPAFFSYFDCLDGVNIIQSNHANFFIIDKYHINLHSNIAQGTFDGKILYSIRLDIDSYLDNTEQINLLLSDSEEMKKVNDLIFKIYISSITERFIELLTDESDFDNTIMIGVEPNER